MHYILGSILFSIFITSCVALLIFSLNYSKLTKYAIIAIAGTIMIAHGSRMIAQGILSPNICYIPNYFDLIFDWLTLILLGFFITWFGFFEFYKREKKIFNQRRNKRIK